MKLNDFKYSNTNKRYHTYSYYLKEKYGQKMFRIMVDAGFTCPNRDGNKTKYGCSFCSHYGSGDMIKQVVDINQQIDDGFKMMKQKWPLGQAMIYFQAYSNTYAPLEELKQLYNPFFFDNRFKEVIIATRCDCLDSEKIAYFQEMTKYKEVWIELGLQTINEKTNRYINRQHSTQEFIDIVKQLKKTNIKVAAHIINGLPFDSYQDCLNSAKLCADLKVDGIKIHMFHVLKNTLEQYRYQKNKYHLLTEEEFVNLVVEQLRLLPPETVILRLTGDGLKDDLIAPLWTLKKVQVLNDIDKRMAKLNIYQGDLYHE